MECYEEPRQFTKGNNSPYPVSWEHVSGIQFQAELHFVWFSSFGKRHATGASSAKRTTNTSLHSTSDRGRICCMLGLYNICNYFRGNPCFFSNSTKLSILDYSKELRRCRPRHTLDKLTSLQSEPRSSTGPDPDLVHWRWEFPSLYPVPVTSCTNCRQDSS